MRIIILVLLLMVLSGCVDSKYMLAPEVKHSDYKTIKTGDGEFFEYKIVYIEGRKFIMYQSAYGMDEIAGPLD